jgi:3-deoxy-D-manno-octulosonate 8-phosphate phosphatase (KDO 8-P phosphatase)
MSESLPNSVRLVAFDVDGTLTDATTWYAGAEVGWTQVYSVRDGEAILRLRARGLTILPLSRNHTAAARQRMELLGCETRWLGVSDKVAAFHEVCEAHAVDAAEVCVIGDGLDDVPTFALAGTAVAVRDAHPAALAAAHHVLTARGGHRAIEALEQWLEDTKRIPRI